MAKLQDERTFFADFYGEGCKAMSSGLIDDEPYQKQLDDLDESIALWEDFLFAEQSKANPDIAETHYYLKSIQECKVAKRELIRKMKSERKDVCVA